MKGEYVMLLKKFITYIALSCCLTLVVFGIAVGQTAVTKEEVQKDVKVAAEKVKAYTAQEAEAYKKDMEKRLEELSKKIDELKERAKNTSGEAAERYRALIADLQGRLDAAGPKLKELGSTTSAAWKDMKVAFDKAVDDLQKAYEDAVSKFK
jgi:peptidoglycan hydrolase CwlO-like protein